MHRLIITIWLILFAFPVITSAQGDLGFNRVNSETYRLYLEQKWDSLIVLGKDALKQEIDYYYLRMRVGIALYNKKNYRKAATHFTAALKFNEDDPVALEYLYYSMLFSGESERASLLRKKFRGDLSLRLRAQKGKIIDRLGVEYLFNYGNNDNLFSNPEEIFSAYPSGVQMTTRQFSNLSLSMTNRIVPGVSLLHAYNFLTKENHYYYKDGTSDFYIEDLKVYQHQYYLSPRITTRSGFTIQPLFHLISGQYQVPLENSPGPQGNRGTTFDFVAYTDYLGGLGLSKGWGCFDLHLDGYYASLNDSEQFQNRTGITWYPAGNLNLYTGGYLNSQYEITSGESATRFVYEMLFGFSVKEKLWFELNAAMGDITNYVEGKGQIVYNSYSDIIEKKVKFSVSIPVTDKGSLFYLGARWTSNRSGYLPVDPVQAYQLNPIIYNAFSIYGGLSWKF